MTRFSATTEFRPGWAERAERFVAVARAIVAFERIWPALWPATGIAGVAVAAALFGLFPLLAWPLHALVLASLVTAIALTLYFHLENFRWPSWDEGARRLERDSALDHRPVSESADQLAAGAGDPFAEELWRAHLKSRLALLPAFRLGLPHSTLPQRDRRGLRFGVLVLILFGLVVARGDSWRRLESLFTPNPGVIATLDAWIEPPAYTGQEPVYLGASAKLSVPAGSILKVRVHGADHRPSVTLDDVRFDGDNGEYAAEAKLTDSDHVRVRAAGRTIGSWRITLIADKPPTIAFAAPPAATERQALKLTFLAGDDYGITAARAIIKPHNGTGAPLIVDLPLPPHSDQPIKLTSFHDLTEHPYAGMDVDITLEAMDAAGNKTTSTTATFKLPQRLFTDPLARALIEQRQNLATQGVGARLRTVKTLDALTYAPDLFFDGKMNAYLAMRVAMRSTGTAETPADFKRVEDLLWQTALSLEHGGILTMADQLRRLQQMIMQAMAQGAPQAEIDALLQRYNELMQRYLAALAATGQKAEAPANPNAKVLGDRDIQELLKAIQALSQAGDRERAMQLLAMLQALLENVQVAGGEGQGGAGQGDQAANEAMAGLGELMGKQRLLLDKTFRQSDGNGDPKDGGAKGLSGQQGQLRGELDALKKKSGKNGGAGGPNLDKAGRYMDEAQQALGLSDFGRATTFQKYVLDELRKGGEAMAKAAGQSQPGKEGQDPMGRASAAQGKASGDLRIPDAQVLQRARDILLELRRRAGQQGRPKEELDYIDRLLKQF
ncbi:DUF4175 domain-containing protein [Rhizomicrobium electricum]|uniref:TIGR02302 family protein n=1 Tax=Rhizomicrobium electricum TaxID=480070 RepID=A0ABN1F4D8_9PROT|nr:DUF4175 family protein [Rhizomicrobium electricum]NIJ49390.1 uncharacterized protein (TIGR02302 family) [Rhizomicrobium electricum]